MSITTIIQWDVRHVGEDGCYMRGDIKCREGESVTDLATVRRVKKAIGWNGKPCRVVYEGDWVLLFLVEAGLMCSISFHYWGRAS